MKYDYIYFNTINIIGMEKLNHLLKMNYHRNSNKSKFYSLKQVLVKRYREELDYFGYQNK